MQKNMRNRLANWLRIDCSNCSGILFSPHSWASTQKNLNQDFSNIEECCQGYKTLFHEEFAEEELANEQWSNEITETAQDFKTDLKMWERFCGKIPVRERPKTFFADLEVCDVEIYKHVYRCLQIGATLSVKVTKSEWSFSTLRILKTYLRKVREERPNELALLTIHRDVVVTTEKILDILVKKETKIYITL